VDKILIVEGGGAEGLYALGVIDYLIKVKHCNFKAMFGTSIGAAITIGLACTYEETKCWNDASEDLIDTMSDLSKWDLIRYPNIFGFFQGGYLVSNIKKTVNKLFTGNRTFNDLSIHCEAMTTDYDADNPVKRLQGSYRLDDAIAMSANIPGVFSYCKDPKTGHRCFDGGVACNEPIGKAVNWANDNNLDPNIEYIIIRMGKYKPFKGMLTAHSAVLHGFFIARNQIEKLSIKLGKVYTNNVTIINIPMSLGLLSFNPKTNNKYITEGFNYAEGYYTNNANR